MLTKNMQKALNEQINKEYFSSYLYLSMMAYFEQINLRGFAIWMRQQTQEELAHAMKIFDYVHERGGEVTLVAIEKPQHGWKSPLDAFEAAYKHEQFISDSINKLVDIARKEKDHATDNFLQWFVSEQVEEESSVDEVVQQLRMAKDAPGALFMLDRELASRPQAGAGEQPDA
ncbi:ferritin [Candidatus Sumerlaeota bacterium]|nr:ferritin [Candidatus Sumerlaeota bacterium]